MDGDSSPNNAGATNMRWKGFIGSHTKGKLQKKELTNPSNNKIHIQSAEHLKMLRKQQSL
jgi:hypothetical protein